MIDDLPFGAFTDERLASWKPYGVVAIPTDELAAFLQGCTHKHRRASKAELLGSFKTWAEFVRKLADNPLVMLHRELAELVVKGALLVLRRVKSNESNDAAQRSRAEQVEWWCANFVRSLVLSKPADAAAADAARVMPLVAQRDARVRELVMRATPPPSSRLMPLPQRALDGSGGGGASSLSNNVLSPSLVMTLVGDTDAHSAICPPPPFGASTVGELLASDSVNLLVPRVAKLLRRLHSSSGLQALACSALLVPPPCERTVRARGGLAYAGGDSGGGGSGGAGGGAGGAGAGGDGGSIGAGGSGSALASLDSAAQGSWRLLLQRLPDLETLAHACASSDGVRREVEEALWSLHKGSSSDGMQHDVGSSAGGVSEAAAAVALGGVALTLLRVLQRAVPLVASHHSCKPQQQKQQALCPPLVSPSTAIPAVPEDHGAELRHLRWRLSLGRSAPALRLVQSEVARLLDPIMQVFDDVSAMQHGTDAVERTRHKRRRGDDDVPIEAKECEAEETMAEDEGEEEEVDLVSVALSAALSSTVANGDGYDGSNGEEDGTAMQRRADARLAALHARRKVWRCVAARPGWAQMAVIQLLKGAAAELAVRTLSAADDRAMDGAATEQPVSALHASSNRDAAFLLWCACPAGPVMGSVSGAAAASEQEERLGTGTLEAARHFIATTAAEVATLAMEAAALEAEAEAEAATALVTRVHCWQSRAGAVYGLTWQMIFAATSVAQNPCRWLRVAIRAVWLESVSHATQCAADVESVHMIEWSWLLLSESLHAGDGGGGGGEGDGHAERNALIVQAVIAGATLVAEHEAERCGGEEEEAQSWKQSQRLLGDAAQSCHRH